MKPPVKYHVGRPNIGDRDALIARIHGMLDRRWLSNDGVLVREFEARIAEMVGVKNCVATCNATVALDIAGRALGLSGEVIVPSYTFVAMAHSLQWRGVTPVFADIDPGTHNIDPAGIEALITPRTTGIMPVHLWGRPADTDAIQKIADRHGLKVMYDAAHAFGCSHNGRMIGTFGSCEVFSFHATKFVNSFEGGAIVTDDDSLAEQLRLMRNFGFHGYDNVVSLGINAKMTEVCAAMGLTSLDAIDEIIAVNLRNYRAYGECLATVPGVSLITFNRNERNNYQYIVIEVDEAQLGCSRDHVISTLHQHGVLARKYFWPGCHRMEPYRTLDPEAGERLPNTIRVADRVIVLPTGQVITAEAVAEIVDMIRASC